MRRATTLIGLFALLAIAAAACAPPPPPQAAAPRTVATTRPPPPPPPPQPPPPPPGLPNAPGGAAAGSVVVSMPNGPDTIDFPDPFVFRPSGSTTWYAYATGRPFVDLQVISSPNLVNWSWIGDPLPGGANGWADLFANSWAPEVIERPNNAASQRFVMYYTAFDRASKQHCIGRATSASPAGPFVDERTSALICQTGGSIDPSPYVAADGTLWLLFSNTTPLTSIWSVRMTPDGLSVAGGYNSLLSTSETWEDGRIEAPTMISSPSGVQLYYSGDETSDTLGKYAVGVARCNGPVGPCTRIYSKPVLKSRGTMVGPGGQTPFQDGSGNWQVAFHAWTYPYIGYDGNIFNTDRRRTLRFLPLTFPNGLPKIG